MDKRQWHHIWTKLRVIKPWYFLILAIASAAICAFSLRANNQHMVSLRQAVYDADLNNTNVQKPLGDLQAYVVKHMNTNLSSGSNPVYPPVQLKYTYNRLVEQQANAVSAASSQIYTDAQHYCEQQNSTDYYGTNRVPCVSAYVQSHPVAKATAIPAELYKFDFISPRWSPDLAGWSMVVAGLSLLAFLKVLLIDYWFKKNIA